MGIFGTKQCEESLVPEPGQNPEAQPKPPKREMLTPEFVKAITDLHEAVEMLKSQMPSAASRGANLDGANQAGAGGDSSGGGSQIAEVGGSNAHRSAGAGRGSSYVGYGPFLVFVVIVSLLLLATIAYFATTMAH